MCRTIFKANLLLQMSTNFGDQNKLEPSLVDQNKLALDLSVAMSQLSHDLGFKTQTDRLQKLSLWEEQHTFNNKEKYNIFFFLYIQFVCRDN